MAQIQTFSKLYPLSLFQNYENAECLIPQYKFNKQGEYNTILTDEMKHILLRFLLHQNKFNYGKAIRLTKEILPTYFLNILIM